MAKKKVLVIDNLAVESSRRTLYRILASRYDYEVHLVVPMVWRSQGGEIACENSKEENLQIHPVKFLFGFRSHRVLYRGLGRIVRALNPDFLYIDTEPENYAAVEVLLLVRAFSPKTKLGLSSWRNIDPLQRGFPYKVSFSHRICDYIIRKEPFDVCFYRPKSAPRYVLQYARKLCYLPWPVDCNTFKRNSTVDKNGPREHIVIGYIGRLVGEKGVDILIKAMPMLPENTRLLIVGNGPTQNELQGLVSKLGIKHRVVLEKAVRYETIPKVLNMVDILVLPSRETKYWKEQFGRILIEAMACETAIVASDSGEIPEVLGDAGLLFEPGDSQELAKNLLQFIEDSSLRAELTKKGRERVLEKYDVTVVAQRMGDYIREVLEN